MHHKMSTCLSEQRGAAYTITVMKATECPTTNVVSDIIQRPSLSTADIIPSKLVQRLLTTFVLGRHCALLLADLPIVLTVFGRFPSIYIEESGYNFKIFYNYLHRSRYFLVILVYFRCVSRIAKSDY